MSNEAEGMAADNTNNGIHNPHGCDSEERKNLNGLETIMRSFTVIGVATAAAYASTHSTDKATGITAWIAVAVVGAATMISGAKTNAQGRL